VQQPAPRAARLSRAMITENSLSLQRLLSLCASDIMPRAESHDVLPVAVACSSPLAKKRTHNRPADTNDQHPQPAVPRFRRRTQLCLAFIALVFVLVIARAAVQTVVGNSVLKLETFSLAAGDGSSLLVEATGVLDLIHLPVGCSITQASLDVVHGGGVVGRLEVGRISLDRGGAVPITIAGPMAVPLGLGPLQALSAAVVQESELELDVAGWVDVHVPLLGHFRQLSLVKRLHLRGAGGLDPLIDSFELQPNQGNATVALSMGVRIRNPSSFQLLSIGVLDFSILTSDGTAFAKVSTVGPVSMRRGVTSLSLTGHLAVPDEESDAFRAVLHDYVSGRSSTGLTAVITAASEPLFDAALSSLRLDTSLPGRPGGAHFFDEIAMSLDVPQALTGLVTSKLVNPWGDAVVHASAACRVSNPFNVSASVQAISIGIVYGGSKVGSVTMPRLDPPLALAAVSRRPSDRAFPIVLRAPATTLNTLLLELLAKGAVTVGLDISLDLRVGVVGRGTGSVMQIAYAEPEVAVRASLGGGETGRAASAASAVAGATSTAVQQGVASPAARLLENRIGSEQGGGDTYSYGGWLG